MSGNNGTSKLSGNLKAARQARSWSTTKAGEVSGVHFTSIYKYERGEATPTVTTLVKLADAYGVPISHLFTDAPLSVDSDGHVTNGAGDPIILREYEHAKRREGMSILMLHGILSADNEAAWAPKDAAKYAVEATDALLRELSNE